ncbi:hypothetical protein Poly41_52210 [Novipirellula artificiosorum]|uniref:Uncharacterized protein n=1 Tax=Novipirellula artificiosorum TaxID=2528016 RepID=A0A5C6DAJ5_9BACT|nr:hypothetical protein Poly41_52210 [Novipirellula artificiosorum]
MISFYRDETPKPEVPRSGDEVNIESLILQISPTTQRPRLLANLRFGCKLILLEIA